VTGGLRQRLWGFWILFRRSRQGVVGLAILAAFSLIALVGPLVVGPVDRAGTFTQLLPPSLEHPFGTDRAGRDLLTVNLHGARVSMIVGLTASLIAVFVGSTIGIIAGFVGGRVDTTLTRITDFFYVLPTLVLALVLASVLGPSMFNVILVIGVTSWPATARVIRSQTLSLRGRAFVDRARAYGAGRARLMTRHIMPNVFPLILANTSLAVATAIFTETTLSFLGVGDKNTFSWGRILEESYDAGALTLGKWAWFVPPGLSVILVVLAFTLIGNALDEIVDPRLRARQVGPADNAPLIPEGARTGDVASGTP
jgi:peptide/nickel transport system permease protein